MEIKDCLVRGIIGDGKARVFALRTNNLVGEAQKRHDTFPIATAALGRTLTTTLVLGSMLKGEETVTVQVKGDGPLQGIVTAADANGHVRGYVGNPYVHLPLNSHGKLSVGEAVGSGTLFVIRGRDISETYQGAVPLQSGEIGDDFAYYFVQSEQTPTAVNVGVLVNPSNEVAGAGGLVVQLLPGTHHDEKFISKLEQIMLSLPPISSVYAGDKHPKQFLGEHFASLGLNIIAETPIAFQCDCSANRFREGLASLGIKELQEMIEEQEDVETQCRFCGNLYNFPVTELQKILSAQENLSMTEEEKERGKND